MLDELFIRGGPVLYILFGLTFLIFTLLVDKYLFIFVQSKTWVNAKFTSFVNSNPPSSTKYKFVEATLISNVKRKTASNIKVLDGLIGMTPMIGLLGTVYGMIEVFEVLSFMGTGNPRAMSSGVAKATIPTMAGMVISLFGLYFRQDLNQRMDKIIINLRDSLKSEGYQFEKKKKKYFRRESFRFNTYDGYCIHHAYFLHCYNIICKRNWS